jgi:hypothetical protein
VREGAETLVLNGAGVVMLGLVVRGIEGLLTSKDIMRRRLLPDIATRLGRNSKRGFHLVGACV